jgi:hypothetical protein
MYAKGKAARVPGDSLFPFRGRDGNWGFFSLAGDPPIPPRYEIVSGFSEGLAAVGVRTPDGLRWGYVDGGGRLTVGAAFRAAHPFVSGIAAVRVEPTGLYGFIDRVGRIVIKPRYDGVAAFSGDICEVVLDGGVSLIGRDGRQIIRSDATELSHSRHHNGLMRFHSGGKWGYVDRCGSIAIACQFEHADDFSDGLAAVRRGSDWFYVDVRGIRALDAAHIVSANPSVKAVVCLTGFSEGRAAVMAPEGWGYIDCQGSFVTQPQYSVALPFIGGAAIVAREVDGAAAETSDGPVPGPAGSAQMPAAAPPGPLEWSVLDMGGAVRLQATCDEMARLCGSWVAIKRAGKWEVRSWRSEETLAQAFDYVENRGPVVFYAVRDGLECWFRSDGMLAFKDPYP